MIPPSPRVLIVSNRLPVTVTSVDGVLHATPSAGGLATGLRGHHERSGGLWIGWPGFADLLGGVPSAELEALLGPLGAVPVPLSAEEITRYYEGVSNGVLWPLFHYLLDQLPLRVEHWDSYVAANARFADVIAEHYRPGDLVWVHDYQLMLVPRMLRERVPGARVGFFLHIPFPSSEVFAALPVREELVRGLLGADLVGFHTPSYARHFARAIERTLGAHAHSLERPTRVTHEGRETAIGVFPMGVDAADLAERAERFEVKAALAHVRPPEGEALLLGVDRLDYTKGIPRRLIAFQQLLERHPRLHGRVRLVQVAVPSRGGVRAYQKIRRDVEGLVGRINGTFGTPRWAPIHYMHRSVTDAELLALYRAATAMLVTPLRDGMNLVAKEFVACRTDEDGVLVLSEFVGAAAELTDAVIVNPYDVDGSADAYYRALTMPPAERRGRMRALRRRVFAYDVHAWSAGFLEALAAPRTRPARGVRPRL
jgi:trehalose 6-phosphate synthase/phosphatase